MLAFPRPRAQASGSIADSGKRNLDGMSWLAPLVNNRLGDRLNLELRHEQLFLSRAIRSSRISATARKGSDLQRPSLESRSVPLKI